MSTEVFVFLPPIPGIYTEVHPYGPSNAGFNTSLEIEIEASSRATTSALALLSGMVRLIPGPATLASEPTTASSDSATPTLTTCTLVLRPLPSVLHDLNNTPNGNGQSIIGGGNVAFIYRNLDLDSIRSCFRLLIEAEEQLIFLDTMTVDSRVDKFIQGKSPYFVAAGTDLGLSSSTLGFEIVFLPSGVGLSQENNDNSWDRLIELIDPSNTATRRLDPASFYTRVVNSTIPVSLAQEHANHPLLSRLTKQILIELRDEYDEPFVGTAMVSDGNGREIDFTAVNRGIVVMTMVPPNETTNPDETADYSISIPNLKFTELPSGQEMSDTPSKTLQAPAHWALSTIMLHYPPGDYDSRAWFSANTEPLPPYTKGNKVTYLLDGIDTFGEMVMSIRATSDSNHYVRLAGWWLNDNFELLPKQNLAKSTPWLRQNLPVAKLLPEPACTIYNLTREIAAHNTKVQALLWNVKVPPLQNNAECVHITALMDDKAILDNETLIYGSHHQKLMIVKNSAGTVAFCGGIDINPNRLDTIQHCTTSPFHDVHAKIEGRAVTDLNLTFVNRWNNHPDVISDPIHKLTEESPNKDLDDPNVEQDTANLDLDVGTHNVQVTRTYPPQKHYPFAPNGDLGTLHAIRKAIQHAKRFIYLEDQYAAPYPGNYPFDPAQDTVGILTDLLAALANGLEYLIIVVPKTLDPHEMPILFRRHQFMRSLHEAYPTKVFSYYLKNKCSVRYEQPSVSTIASDIGSIIDQSTISDSSPDIPYFNLEFDDNTTSNSSSNEKEIYVHSKTWIIDDIYAKIGSANCCRRSYTHDSEVDIHVIDGALHNGARAFARNYRMALWGEHLNMRGSLRYVLEDPSFALGFWKTPPKGAHIAPYNIPESRIDPANTLPFDSLWNTFFDPDGR
jgi:phosphatidylserine/phosphatidylglycerophosphate/cardiolipin synthase-like enzyme